MMRIVGPMITMAMATAAMPTDCCTGLGSCSDPATAECVGLFDPYCLTNWDAQCREEAIERCSLQCGCDPKWEPPEPVSLPPIPDPPSTPTCDSFTCPDNLTPLQASDFPADTPWPRSCVGSLCSTRECCVEPAFRQVMVYPGGGKCESSLNNCDMPAESAVECYAKCTAQFPTTVAVDFTSTWRESTCCCQDNCTAWEDCGSSDTQTVVSNFFVPAENSCASEPAAPPLPMTSCKSLLLYGSDGYSLPPAVTDHPLGSLDGCRVIEGNVAFAPSSDNQLEAEIIIGDLVVSGYGDVSFPNLKSISGTISMAPRAATNFADPEMLSDETLAEGTNCTDLGYFALQTVEMCEFAAAEMGLSDTSASTTSSTSRPQGCYWHNGNRLWFNTRSGHFGGTQINNDRLQICSKTEAYTTYEFPSSMESLSFPRLIDVGESIKIDENAVELKSLSCPALKHVFVIEVEAAPQLQRIELPRLLDVSLLTVEQNPMLEDVVTTSLQTSYQVYFDQNPKVLSLSFEQLQKVDYWIFIDEMEQLKSVDFPVLHSTDDFNIQNCHNVESVFLPSLSSVMGDIMFDGMNSLGSITAPNLIRADNLYFWELPQLSVIDFTSLLWVIESVSLSGVGLEGAEFPSLQNMGNLVVEDNAVLNTVSLPVCHSQAELKCSNSPLFTTLHAPLWWSAPEKVFQGYYSEVFEKCPALVQWGAPN